MYLTSKLGVPKDHIQLLCEEQATRTGIMNAFHHLADDSNGIQCGDTIDIFFAGYGARALPPGRLSDMPWCSIYIKLLHPYDFYDKPRNYGYGDDSGGIFPPIKFYTSELNETDFLKLVLSTTPHRHRCISPGKPCLWWNGSEGTKAKKKTQ
ncbi:hypothetical protein BDN70DRAFT_532956 [Pholiota conissans]|uniref:Uncharacterized protein n=1 Tax=Pholiota conissans TaxID=109636 RepID=A0A9P6D6H9_9AGAR|nr:hypothetical protein BDN70DRAFT_532956 [Pholiota conissans]